MEAMQHHGLSTFPCICWRPSGTSCPADASPCLSVGHQQHIKGLISGSLQDWSYVAMSCMELTLELSEQKWPPESQLPALWADNKPALLALPLMALFGGLRCGSAHHSRVSMQALAGMADCGFSDRFHQPCGVQPTEHAAIESPFS